MSLYHVLLLSTRNRLWKCSRDPNEARTDMLDDWKVHHENPLAHTVFSMTLFLTESNVLALSQSSNNPDLGPPGFIFFPLLKTVMVGPHF